MLDINLIREEPEKVREGIAKKNFNPQLVDDFLALDGEWRKLTKEIDDLRSGQKKLGEKRKLEEAKELKIKIQILESNLKTTEGKRQEVLLKFPNLPFEDVPVGKDESENVVIRQDREPQKFNFEIKDHVSLGENLGVIEIEKAGEIAGSRFNYIMGDLARMEYAIVQHVFSILTDKKIIKKIAKKIESGYSDKLFTPVVPPVMIKPEVFKRMARLDPGQEEERYYLQKDNLYLIGSAEHTLGPLHMDEIIKEEELPIRYIGFSTSFRREAGSYGKDVRGILRVHQFDKLEMESFTVPENSRKEQDFIVAIQEYLIQTLKIPYQVINICTGDMGDPDARQIDMECWIPSQNKYRETHTSDLMTDFQSRRLGTKVRRKDGSLEYIHMNDATAFAIGRILIAIMENYQTKEGYIKVPEALQGYLGIDIIKPRT